MPRHSLAHGTARSKPGQPLPMHQDRPSLGSPLCGDQSRAALVQGWMQLCSALSGILTSFPFPGVTGIHPTCFISAPWTKGWWDASPG